MASHATEQRCTKRQFNAFESILIHVHWHFSNGTHPFNSVANCPANDMEISLNRIQWFFTISGIVDFRKVSKATFSHDKFANVSHRRVELMTFN